MEQLNTVRQKQTKKAKRRNKARKRISRETYRRLLIMGAIILVIVLSIIIFFRVRSIEVQGNSYYTKEEIAAAAKTEKGDNLLLLSRGEIAGNIMAHCPYVSSVRVSRQLPDTVIISVEEYDAAYAVQDSRGDYYLVTAGGKATEKITHERAKEHITIEDMRIVTPEIGGNVHVMAPQGEEIAAMGQMEALKQVLNMIENRSMQKEIYSVSVPSSHDISLWYKDRFLVRLGDTSDLDYKISYLKQVVESQKNYATGTIDLTQAIDGNVYVTLNEE